MHRRFFLPLSLCNPLLEGHDKNFARSAKVCQRKVSLLGFRFHPLLCVLACGCRKRKAYIFHARCLRSLGKRKGASIKSQRMKDVSLVPFVVAWQGTVFLVPTLPLSSNWTSPKSQAGTKYSCGLETCNKRVVEVSAVCSFFYAFLQFSRQCLGGISHPSYHKRLMYEAGEVVSNGLYDVKTFSSYAEKSTLKLQVIESSECKWLQWLLTLFTDRQHSVLASWWQSLQGRDKKCKQLQQPVWALAACKIDVFTLERNNFQPAFCLAVNTNCANLTFGG